MRCATINPGRRPLRRAVVGVKIFKVSTLILGICPMGFLSVMERWVGTTCNLQMLFDERLLVLKAVYFLCAENKKNREVAIAKIDRRQRDLDLSFLKHPPSDEGNQCKGRIAFDTRLRSCLFRSIQLLLNHYEPLPFPSNPTNSITTMTIQ